MRHLASALAAICFAACATGQARAEQLSCAARAEVNSLDAYRKAVLSVHNGCGTKIRLVWVDYRGGRHLYAVIGPGRTYQQYTYETHPWLINGSRGECLGLLVISAPAEAVYACGAPSS